MDVDEAKHTDLERTGFGRHDAAAIGHFPTPTTSLKINVAPFAGRLGGVGTGVLLPSTDSQDALVQEIPDASPCMTLAQIFNFNAFRTPLLWKAALIEGMGTLMLTWLTIYASISPATIPDQPTTRWGLFDNAAFIGPLIGGVTNFLYLTIFTYCFGAVSGAHLNPMITIATLLARLCSFPRAVLYVSAQTVGAALGGLLVRASYGSRAFKVGGCWLYSDIVPVREAFVVELMCCTIILFFAFGVGLDPRQRQTIGPTLGPFLVGLSLGSLSFGTAYSKYGYGGASMNPARCLGSFVGSRFPGWHWIHWVAPCIASAVHAVFYYIIPPWQISTGE